MRFPKFGVSLPIIFACLGCDQQGEGDVDLGRCFGTSTALEVSYVRRNVPSSVSDCGDLSVSMSIRPVSDDPVTLAADCPAPDVTTRNVSLDGTAQGALNNFGTERSCSYFWAPQEAVLDPRYSYSVDIRAGARSVEDCRFDAYALRPAGIVAGQSVGPGNVPRVRLTASVSPAPSPILLTCNVGNQGLFE